MATTEPTLEELYGELSRRGLLKEEGSELQALGHELRKRKLITDPTQGGLVQPQAPQTPAPNITVNVQVPQAVQTPQPQAGGVPVLPPMPPGYQLPPLAEALKGFAPTPGQVAPPPPAPAPPPGRPVSSGTVLPRVMPVSFEQSPAEAKFEKFDAAWKRNAGATVILPSAKQEMKQQQVQSLAELGGTLPQMAEDLRLAYSRLEYEKKQIAAIVEQDKRGELSEKARLAALQFEKQHQQNVALYEQRRKRLEGYEKRYTGMLKSYGDRPLHTGTLYPEEVKPKGRLDQATQKVRGFLAPQTVQAERKIEQNRKAAMATGAYPWLPPLPPEARTPEQRAHFIREKNKVLTDLQTLMQHGATPESNPQAFARMTASYSPWQQKLFPIIQQQVIAERDAMDRSKLGRAQLADLGAGVAAWYAGGLASRALTPILIGKLPQIAAATGLKGAFARTGIRAISGAAGGGPASSAAAATSTAIMGGKPAQIEQAAKSAFLPGVAFGAVAGAALGAGSEAVRKIREAKTAAQIQQVMAELKQRTSAPLTADELAALEKTDLKRFNAVKHWQSVVDDLQKTIDDVEAGNFKRIKEYKDAAERVVQARENLERATNAAKLARRRPGAPEPPTPEAPAAPATGAGPTPKPKPAPKSGGGAPTQTVTTPRGPVVETPQGPIPLRETPPAVLASLAQATQNPAITQHLEQHTARQAMLTELGVPPEARPKLAAQWNDPRNPARVQAAALTTAAERAPADDLRDKMNEAAQETQAGWNYNFAIENAPDGNTILDHPAVAPPQVSVWRRLTEEEQAQLTPAARKALLIQDINNSAQVLDPEALFTFTAPAGNEAALRQRADTLFDQAQSKLEADFAAPAAPETPVAAGAPSPLTAPAVTPEVAPPAPAAGMPAGTPETPPVAPQPTTAPQTPGAPAAAVETPQAAAAPITEADLQPGFTWRTPAGRVMRVQNVRPDGKVHAEMVEGADKGGSLAPGTVVTFDPRDVMKGTRVAVTPPAAVAPEMPALDVEPIGRTGGSAKLAAVRGIGKAGVPKARAQAREREEAIGQVGRTGGKQQRQQPKAEDRVLEVLGPEPLDIDQIMAKTGLTRDQVNAAVTRLDLNGQATRVPGNAYIRRKAPTPQAAEAPPTPTRPERRKDLERRKRVEEMTPEERAHHLLTDELTGLGNLRAYREHPKLTWQASADADSLKFWNDTFGHPFGDSFLRMVGVAIKEAQREVGLHPTKLQTYHISGDEFVAQSDDLDALREVMRRAAEKIEQATLTLRESDGTARTFTGAGMTYAIDQRNEEEEHGTFGEQDYHYRPAYADADQTLKLLKAERQAQGLRAARGEPPPRFAETTPGREAPAPAGGGGVAVAEREEGDGAVHPVGEEFQLQLEPPPASAAPPLAEFYRFSDLAESNLKAGQLIHERATGNVYNLVRRRVGVQPFWEAELWEDAEDPGVIPSQRINVAGEVIVLDRQEFTAPELLEGFDYAQMTVAFTDRPEAPRQQEVAEEPEPIAELGPSPAWKDLKEGMILQHRERGERRILGSGPYMSVVPGVGNTRIWHMHAITWDGKPDYTTEFNLHETELNRWAIEAAPAPVVEPTPETPSAPPTTETPRTTKGYLVPGTERFIQAVRNKIEGRETIAANIRELNHLAQLYLKGSLAQGTYDTQDIYDALETALNRHVQGPAAHELALRASKEPEKALEFLRDLLSRFPTQTIRTKEKIEFQQFSTPPTIAFVAAYALNPTREDVILEPSAGTGSLAAMAQAVSGGATIITNELAPRRRELLSRVLNYPTWDRDAERLNSTLPQNVKPTAVIMNPPFSATGGRVRQHKNEFGFRHLEEALKRLQPGGRLVAIMGRGASFDHSTAAPFWNRVRQEYNVRANVGMPGSEYTKYGTSFDNQLIVIDKTGPTTGEVLTGNAESLEQLVRWIDDAQLRNRAPILPVPKRPAGDVGVSPVSDEPRERAGGAPAPSGRGGARPGSRRRDTAVEPRQRAGGDVSPTGEGEPAIEPASAGERRPVRRGAGDAVPDREPVTPEAPPEPVAAPTPTPPPVMTEEREEQIETAGFTPYKARSKGIPHPGEIVETAGMGDVEAPKLAYKHKLKELTTKPDRPGRGISAAQVDAVAMTGQRHERILPTGERAAALNGDGTGTGKGRTNAAILADNWEQGRRRQLWVSVGSDLMGQAKDDFEKIEYGEIPLVKATDISGHQPIDLKEGVIFATYTFLQHVVGPSPSTTEKSAYAGKQRWEQLRDWLGEDGVVIFDESHKLKNTGSDDGSGQRKQDPAKVAQAALDLTVALPKLRVVYSSATAMTSVKDMGYMTRLGLWGPGTAFPEGFKQFASAMERGGLGQMEQTSRDMKALGMYNARFLSYDGVQYDEQVHTLTPEQEQIYANAAAAWRTIEENMGEAFKLVGGDRKRVDALKMAYWGTNQRFFKDLVTALKVPSVIQRTEQELKAGRSVIISLIGTGEAKEKRQIKKAISEGIPLEDLDFSPRDAIIQFVKRAFPIQNFVEVTDKETGKTKWVEATLPDGSPEINPEAKRIQDELVDYLERINLPQNPLDEILNHFGHQNVAEMTGRGKRREKDENGNIRLVTPPKLAVEQSAFQSGRKRIAITSKKASTGISLHANLAEKNQQQRVHILMELPWSADEAMQIFGRSHRTNQAHPPIYVLMSTNVGGERRFSSTIASRLASLGALTRASRSSAGSGDVLAKYNYDSDYGTTAVDLTMVQMFRARVGQMPGLPENVSPFQILEMMGAIKRDPERGTQLRDFTLNNFFNRILSIPLEYQNPVFAVFEKTFQSLVAQAKQEGTFDEGMTDVPALTVREIGEPTLLNEDRESGSRTRLHTVEIVAPAERVPVGDLPADAKFARNVRSEKLWVFRPAGTRHNQSTNQAELAYKRSSPTKWDNGDLVFESELANEKAWAPLTPAAGRKEWEREFTEAPETRTTRTNLVSGVIMPILGEVQAVVASTKVLRVPLESGKRLLGIEIPEDKVPKLRRVLGVGQAQVSPDEAWNSAWAGETVLLRNGVLLQRRTIAGETVVEISRGPSGLTRMLAERGFPGAIQDATRRVWLPQGDKGRGLFNQLVAEYPPVSIGASAAELQKAMQVQQRQGPPPPESGQKGGEVEPEPEGDASKVEVYYAGNRGRPRAINEDTWKARWGRFQDVATRDFRYLDRQQHAELLLFLRRLKKGRAIASQEAMIEMADVVRGLSKEEYGLFNYALIVLDMDEERRRQEARLAEREEEGDVKLPGEINTADVAAALREVQKRLAVQPQVREAINRRREAMERIKTEYQEAVTSVLGKPPVLDREDYFRHQVFAYLSQDRPGLRGAGNRVEAPTHRGFLKARFGSLEAYNTDWIEAEHEVLSQMVYDTMVYRLLDFVQRRYDIKSTLKARAASENEANLRPFLESLAADLNKERGPHLEPITPEDAFRRTFNWKQAAGFDSLRKLAEKDALPDTQQGHWSGLIAALASGDDLDDAQSKRLFQYAAWILREHGGEPGSRGAAMIMAGIREKRARMKTELENLGEKFVTWEDMIPETHRQWRPREGSVVFRAWSVPDRIADQLHEEGAKALGLEGDELKRVMVMGGKRRAWVLPNEVADTLDHFNSASKDDIERASAENTWRHRRQQAIGAWKVYQLLNPKRWVGYNLRNEVGDLEAMLFNRKEGYVKLARAAAELAAFMTRQGQARGPVAPELREWLRRGGMQSTLQDVEKVGAGGGLDLLAKFASKKAPFKEKAWNFVWQRARLTTDFREAVGRYAMYLDYLEQMQNSEDGLPENFGSTDPRQLLPLKDVRDRAWKLSNDLLAAYDEVSELGQLIAAEWVPFWRWQEANWRRTWQIVGNVRYEMARAGGGGGMGQPPEGPGAGPGGDWMEDLPPWHNPKVALEVGRRLALLSGRKVAGTALKATALIALGKFAIKAQLLYDALYAWNSFRFPELMDKIPEHDRGRPLMILGQNKITGEVYYYTRLGALVDVASWFGVDNASGLWADWANGRKSLAEIAGEVALTPFEKVLTSLGPTMQAGEALFGAKLFPEPFRPRPIRDKVEHGLDSFSLGDEYRLAKGQLAKRGYWTRFLGLRVAHPGEAAHQEMVGLARKFARKRGKPDVRGDFSAKGEAAYRYRASVKRGDQEGMEHWLRLLAEKHKATDETMARSLKTIDPLHGLNEDDARAFLETLSRPDQERMWRAYRWYADITAPDANLTILPGRTFARRIEKARDRINDAIDKARPLKKMGKKDPALRKVVRANEKAAAR